MTLAREERVEEEEEEAQFCTRLLVGQSRGEQQPKHNTKNDGRTEEEADFRSKSRRSLFPLLLPLLSIYSPSP